MACVAVTSLVRTLELEFLQPQLRPIVQENGLISENKELIISLREKLEDLMEQLDEKRMDGVEAIKDLETKLRDVAFRVEDEIELQVVDLYVETSQRADDDEQSHNCLRCCQIFHRAEEKPQKDTDEGKIQPCLRLHHILQKAIEDVDHIKEELVKIKDEYKHVILQVSTTTVGVLPKSDKVMMVDDSSQHASHLEDIMVGKDDEFKTIMELLIKHSSRHREVVTIQGMGGIGKTTLAKRVYEDPSIASHFDKRAWIVSSQHHDKSQMLEGLLINLKADENDEKDDTTNEERVYQGLKGKRYLVVMDDVWSKEAWDAIKACFPEDRNGSRVLMTTRLAYITHYTYSASDFSHEVNLLDQSESWNLFCEKTCRTHTAEFEMIGRPIVKKCKGLPLAIIVVAGLFSKLNTLNEWENIAEALNSSETTTIVEACSRVFSFNYNHLPYKLKACFLYLGVFPEDDETYTNNLVRLWAAEGLVKTFENESFEGVARRHIQELVDRNLILVSKRSSNGKKIKTLRIHDLLHEFCVREAQNEKLLKIVGKSSFNFHHKDFRWVSIQSPRFDFQRLYASSKTLRSIFYFPTSSTLLNLQNFNLLRVFYSSRKFCRNVHPIHLRYLSSLTLNSKPCNTWNLQTLYSGASSSSYILEFPQLCHYNCSYIACPDCPNFVHQNLQSFSGLSLSCCTKKLFTNTPCIKKVSIVKMFESVIDCISYIGNLAYLEQLESLKIRVVIFTDSFRHPINYQIALLKTLKKLSLFYTRFSWEEINIFSTLPRLEVLKLENFACEGERWKLREEEIFSQLICLKLYINHILYLEASGYHFPKLESLILQGVHLHKIPSTFAEISTLKSITLKSCYLSAVTSAKKIQKEQHDQGNYNMVVIEKDTIVRSQIMTPKRRMRS